MNNSYCTLTNPHTNLRSKGLELLLRMIGYRNRRLLRNLYQCLLP